MNSLETIPIENITENIENNILDNDLTRDLNQVQNETDIIDTSVDNTVTNIDIADIKSTTFNNDNLEVQSYTGPSKDIVNSHITFSSDFKCVLKSIHNCVKENSTIPEAGKIYVMQPSENIYDTLNQVTAPLSMLDSRAN